MITDLSRNLLTEVVQIVDPVTGKLAQPEFVNLRQRVTDTAPDDQFVAVTSAKDWSHISLERLGDARHWWIWADLSDVIDPFEELTPGRQLRGPSVNRFLFSIMSPVATP